MIPLRRLLRSRLWLMGVVVIVSGCGLLLGGGNPRPDDASAKPPPPHDGVATWSSLAWQPVTVERPAKASQEQWDQLTGLAAGPGGWVAVGSNGDVTSYVGRIWQSPDSLTWNLVGNGLLAGLELVDIAATSEAYVAIGTDSTNINDAATSILRSTDGLTWTEVQAIPEAWASDIAAGPNGFAAIGQSSETNDVWLSSDGLTWTLVGGEVVGPDTRLADIAWDRDGWIAVGSADDRAVVVRSTDGTIWTEDTLPASEPVEGIINVAAYRVIPGRWATLVLGLEQGPSCAEDDDWCDKYQAAWSWTAETGWARLPKSNWLLDKGYGIEAFAAGDAGFISQSGSDAHTSADGWEWVSVKQSNASTAFVVDMVVTADRVVAVGMPMDVETLDGWIGSAVIVR